MGQSLIKNPRKLFSQSGGDPSHENRITILENNEYKITYFTEISDSTGTITIPTGATILLDQLQGGVDAYVCTIQNGQPTGDFPQTGLGVTVDVTSFDALGNYTLSDTPSGYPVALIYILKIKAKDYSNLDITKILDLEDIGIISQTIRDGVTTSAPSEDAVFDALGAKKDTFMLQSGSAALNPADATTYYLGLSGIAPNTTATNFAFKIGYDFRVVGCIILSANAGTAGTAENNTVNFRNITTATSTLISNSVKTNSTSTSHINQTVTGLNITGAANDDVCFEWITPTWVTNPTTCTLILRVYIEKLS